jgi:hypothetical protein
MKIIKMLTLIQKLDIVLSVFDTVDTPNTLMCINLVDIEKRIKGKNLVLSNRLRKEILYKLVKDGNLRIEKGFYRGLNTGGMIIDYYYITVEGEILKSTGGYHKRNRKESISTILQSVQTWAIAVGTVLAALGTIGLLVYEILKTYYPPFCPFH